MPLHDWARTTAGLFDDFQQTWSIQMKLALNAGILPKGLSALVEQRSGPWQSDVLAIESLGRPRSDFDDEGGVATTAPPATRFAGRTSKQIYAARANRIVVKHRLGHTIAVIEIVSPGNKDSRARCGILLRKSSTSCAGIHVLVIDVFPPTPRDPFGIHKAIWDEVEEQEFAFPEGKDRILASYETGAVQAYYVEAIGVGDSLPAMPLFLRNGWQVPVPLESTYLATWNTSPEEFRVAVETGVMPELDAD